LENLADHLDTLPPGAYNQFDIECCALGHYWNNFERTIPVNGIIAAHFGITLMDVEMLFGSYGCGSAQYDHKKAAAYIRRFVMEKRRVSVLGG
jgi:hypothetical protein